MAHTVTTVINAATVGSTSSRRSNITELTLQAGTSLVALEITFAPGAAAETGSIRVYWADSITNLGSNSAAVDQLFRGSSFFELPKNLAPVTAHIFTIPARWVNGEYITFWVDEPVLAATGTLTVKATEYAA